MSHVSDVWFRVTDLAVVEFRQPETGMPDTARVAAILGHCLTEGHLILMSAGTYWQAIR